MKSELKVILAAIWCEGKCHGQQMNFAEWLEKGNKDGLLEKQICEAVGRSERRARFSFPGIADEIVALQERKNHDYGNAFQKSYDEFGIITAVIRLTDKLNRLKNLLKTPGRVIDETFEDTLKDLAAYAIMTIESIRLHESQSKAGNPG